MDDFYNGVADATVETIKSDSWLGDTSNIKKVAANLTSDGDNAPVWDSNEVPAIYVECLGEQPSPDIETQAERGVRLNVIVEIVHYSDDLGAAKVTVRKIAARMSQLISRQQSEIRFPDQATQLDGFAEGGQVEYPNDVSFGSGPVGNGYLVLCMLRFFVRIFDPN